MIPSRLRADSETATARVQAATTSRHILPPDRCLGPVPIIMGIIVAEGIETIVFIGRHLAFRH
jgi:hypothetical protein